MERLFRDRMEYVTKGADGGCFICDAVSSDDPDSALVLSRSDSSVVVMNLYPYNSGHVIVAPSRHVGDLTELDAEEALDLITMTQRSVSSLRQAFDPQGFNIGANLGEVAGAGLPDHLHLHVVPRWGGDTNFMPVTAQSKVIPETLEKTFARLKAQFEAT